MNQLIKPKKMDNFSDPFSDRRPACILEACKFCISRAITAIATCCYPSLFTAGVAPVRTDEAFQNIFEMFVNQLQRAVGPAGTLLCAAASVARSRAPISRQLEELFT